MCVTSTTSVQQIGLDAARIAHDRRAYLWRRTTRTSSTRPSARWTGREVVDEVDSYAGLRDVDRLRRTAAAQRDARYSCGWCSPRTTGRIRTSLHRTTQALRREVELVKELGFNGIRIHQKVEDPRYLYWCDRLGVRVWTEMPSAFVFDPVAVDRLTREWAEVVARDAQPPAVLAWVPFNESWGLPQPAQRHRAAARGPRALLT